MGPGPSCQSSCWGQVWMGCSPGPPSPMPGERTPAAGGRGGTPTVGRWLQAAGGKGIGDGVKKRMLWYWGAEAVVLCTHRCCLPILCTPTQYGPVGKVGAGWHLLTNAIARQTEFKEQFWSYVPSSPSCWYLRLFWTSSFATRGMRQATLCGISWQLGTP